MSGYGRLLLCSLIAGTLVLACTPAGRDSQAPVAPATAQQAVKKRVLAAVSSEPTNLSDTLNFTNAGAAAAGATELEQLVHVGLSVMNDQGQRVPRLAEAVPTVENGLWVLLPDNRMETRYTIRPNVVWHDGTPFTADDLVFTAAVTQDRDLAVFRNPGFAFIDSVELVDPRTVTVRWKGPYIDADAMFADRFAVPLPKHILESRYLENKATLPGLSYWNEDFVGTGPFKVRSFTPGSGMVLEANDAYVLGRPRIDEIEVKFVLDPNAMIANVLAGQVELTLGRGLTVEQAEQVVQKWTEGRSDVAIYNLYELIPQFISPTPAGLTNVDFRRALLRATNRQELVDSLLFGLTPVAHSTMVTPNQREYADVNRFIVRYEYDPRLAEEAIARLGYTRGSDGRFRDSANQPVVLEIRSQAGEDLNNKTALAIRDQWQAVGLGVDPVIVPAPRRQDKEYRWTKPAFDLLQQRPLLVHYQSKEVPLPENNFQGDNPSRYSSRDLDGLIDQYFATMLWGSRMEVFGQIIRHLSSEVVDMGLFYTATPQLIANRLINAAAAKSPPPANQAWNAHEWDVR
jgi:peptide/nickel transport system substrate-binding protein